MASTAGKGFFKSFKGASSRDILIDIVGLLLGRDFATVHSTCTPKFCDTLNAHRARLERGKDEKYDRDGRERWRDRPTFNPDIAGSPLHHDVVLLERWSIALNKYTRGDVVTLWSPQNPDLLTTKRIVALEGDLLPPDEQVHPLPPHSPTPVRIPPGHCWVEGDSQFQTRDSNTYGPVPLALINSRVAAVVWPWGRTGWVQNGAGKSKGRIKRFGAHLK